MEKRRFSQLSVLVVLIAFLTACSQKAEYTNVIPSDASAVVSINFKSLGDKAGLGDKENEPMKQKMMDALKNEMNAATFQQLETIMKNPSESGIDIAVPAYIFYANSFPHTTMVAKVTSADKLRTSMEAMEKEQISSPVTTSNGCNFATINNVCLLAFNETTVMVTDMTNASTEDLQKAISELMSQPAEKSISSQTGFQNMQKQKGDIDFLVTIGNLPKTFTQQITAGLPSEIDLKEIMVLGRLNFEKGKVSLRAESYTENAEIKELLKKQGQISKELSTNFLKYFPESTLTFLNFGINGEAFYNLLLENEEFRNNMSIAKADEVKKLFASLNGDISAGLINVTMNSAPTFAAYAEMENGTTLKALYDNKKQLGLRRGDDIIQLSENEYVYKSKDMNVFFGYRDKQMYATNDELLYKNIGKAIDKSIKDAPYASNMKGMTAFFVINIEAILELPVIKMMIGFGGNEYKTYYNIGSQFSYLEVTGDKDSAAEINLILKNKDINALKQIVDMTRQFAGM